jgi:hypothetical protein
MRGGATAGVVENRMTLAAVMPTIRDVMRILG